MKLCASYQVQWLLYVFVPEIANFFKPRNIIWLRYNNGLAIYLLNCFYKKFMQRSTSVILFNFCTENLLNRLSKKIKRDFLYQALALGIVKVRLQRFHFFKHLTKFKEKKESQITYSYFIGSRTM